MQSAPTNDDPDGSKEHLLRRFTRRVPFRAGATLLNALFGAFGGEPAGPRWLVSEGVDGLPAMELDVSRPFQRRMFYFPRAYWGRLLGLPFGRFLAATLEEGQTFVDIGANVGFYSLFAARRVGGGGRVLSFEPDPVTFESLRRSLARNGYRWASCRNVALSDRAAEMPFFTVSDGSAHSLVPEVERRRGRYSGQVAVRVARLDDLLLEDGLGLERIDLVKIDVEGEEERTVAGMLETLTRFAYPPVWAEVRGPRGSTRAPNTYPGVARTLGGLGYRPFHWERGDLRLVESDEIQGREDVLFRRP